MNIDFTLLYKNTEKLYVCNNCKTVCYVKYTIMYAIIPNQKKCTRLTMDKLL